jgi:hypothetical protein
MASDRLREREEEKDAGVQYHVARTVGKENALQFLVIAATSCKSVKSIIEVKINPVLISAAIFVLIY